MDLAAPSPPLITRRGDDLPAPPDRLREAAEGFEAVFLSTVIGRMLASLPSDGPFGGGHAEATFRGFLAEEYANELVRAGGIGIADAVQAELIALQEGGA